MHCSSGSRNRIEELALESGSPPLQKLNSSNSGDLTLATHRAPHLMAEYDEVYAGPQIAAPLPHRRSTMRSDKVVSELC